MKKKHRIQKLLCPSAGTFISHDFCCPRFCRNTCCRLAFRSGNCRRIRRFDGSVYGTGALFDKDMNEIRYPASTTKAMTALLILENIDDLNQKVTFTDVILPDLAPGNSTINAQVGEELTVEQCLYAIMLGLCQ